MSAVELTLSHDTNKELKAGKRRYSDGEGHTVYLSGPEVEQLGSVDKIKLTMEPA
jgi:hypothetical protein